MFSAINCVSFDICNSLRSEIENVSRAAFSFCRRTRNLMLHHVAWKFSQSFILKSACEISNCRIVARLPFYVSRIVASVAFVTFVRGLISIIYLRKKGVSKSLNQLKQLEMCIVWYFQCIVHLHVYYQTDYN